MLRAIDCGLLLCLECHALAHIQSGPERQYCSRCGARIFVRRPHSLARTWALLVSAAIMYLPANLLPIMTVHNLGRYSPDTIFSGILALFGQGMYGIAAIVLLASILVPSLKLLGMAALLISVQRRVRLSPRQRVLTFRFIEWIGRWSMMDIFVIAGLVKLVSFGNLASVEAGLGALAFASVVILTMLAALSFDPRLIWDHMGAEDD